VAGVLPNLSNPIKAAPTTAGSGYLICGKLCTKHLYSFGK